MCSELMELCFDLHTLFLNFLKRHMFPFFSIDNYCVFFLYFYQTDRYFEPLLKSSRKGICRMASTFNYRPIGFIRLSHNPGLSLLVTSSVIFKQYFRMRNAVVAVSWCRGQWYDGRRTTASGDRRPATATGESRTCRMSLQCAASYRDDAIL